MAHEALQVIVGTAIVDSRFCRRLLADKSDALSDFDLTADEKAIVARTRATTIQGFAQDLHTWIDRRDTAADALSW